MFGIRPTLLGAVALSALVACSDDPTESEPVCAVSNINISNAPQTILVGALATLEADVTSTNCETPPTVVWASSAMNVAVVSQSGAVTAIVTGTTTISAAAGGKTSSVVIQVVAGDGEVVLRK
jgi:alpha-amylase